MNDSIVQYGLVLHSEAAYRRRGRLAPHRDPGGGVPATGRLTRRRLQSQTSPGCCAFSGSMSGPVRFAKGRCRWILTNKNLLSLPTHLTKPVKAH